MGHSNVQLELGAISVKRALLLVPSVPLAGCLWLLWGQPPPAERGSERGRWLVAKDTDFYLLKGCVIWNKSLTLSEPQFLCL